MRHLRQLLMRRAYREVLEVGGSKVDDLLLQLRKGYQADNMVSEYSNNNKAEAGEADVTEAIAFTEHEDNCLTLRSRYSPGCLPWMPRALAGGQAQMTQDIWPSSTPWKSSKIKLNGPKALTSRCRLCS